MTAALDRPPAAPPDHWTAFWTTVQASFAATDADSLYEHLDTLHTLFCGIVLTVELDRRTGKDHRAAIAEDAEAGAAACLLLMRGLDQT
jgi:hypothetical protein